MLGSNINTVPKRNIYGSASGPSLGNGNSPVTPFDGAMGSQSGTTTAGGATLSSEEVSAAGSQASKGFLGQPLTWFVLLMVMLIGLKFIAQKLGEDGDFKNIRVTIHNVIIISLSSIIGIGFFKVLFNRFKVPGLTTYINAV